MRRPPARLPAAPRRRLLLTICAALATAVAMLSLVGLTAGASGSRLGATHPVAGTDALDRPRAVPVADTRAPVAATAAVVVHIKNYAFSPSALKVSAGQKVTWINDDSAPHTVTTTSGPKKIDSGEMDKGASFSYTFTTAGTYSYYCAYHPDMKAAVTVSGGGASPTPTAKPTAKPTSKPTGHPMPSGTPTPPPGDGTPCTGALNEMLTIILQHIYTAHLQRSPSQQIADALALDQYIKTHTAWVQMILESGVGGVQEVLKGLQPLLQHLYVAHLQRSPAEQLSDALAVDSYLKSHTVLVQDILKPGLDGLLGGGC
ncbi:Amicyanin precursor [Actinomadura rubteroloni]|uniref:Amicyanin n=1 Tax=Actinomadura rubteroloni TaxID=1926885 RepID=A0A2P4UIH5_9ACTN|nr:cupredoxin family copper-binding protein [Actinomadura rubteroloni]POM24798.1 Amicyanin precursor [Actinomadura rubteroloni]